MIMSCGGFGGQVSSIQDALSKTSRCVILKVLLRVIERRNFPISCKLSSIELYGLCMEVNIGLF